MESITVYSKVSANVNVFFGQTNGKADKLTGQELYAPRSTDAPSLPSLLFS